MPKEQAYKYVTSHPCHLLSLPSAKRFWCRHCMTVFEDAISRWRHSRWCRHSAFNNFFKRKELEAKALQNTPSLSSVEARLEQSIQLSDLASTSTPCPPDPNEQPQILPNPENFTCFICQTKFASMEGMRHHVKYPCSNSKIITSRVPHPKHSVPVFIDALPTQHNPWQTTSQPQQVVQQSATYVQSQPQQQPAEIVSIETTKPDSETEPSYDNSTLIYDNAGNSVSDSITPTSIYVNEQGETVIEVENLDLNTEGGELSLAHLLTQLSQQGIVFDKTRSAQLQAAEHKVTVSSESGNTLYTTEATFEQSSGTPEVEEEEGQPTAEDAANTLAQLAGFRSFRSSQQQEPSQQISNVDTYGYSNNTARLSKQYAIASEPQVDIKYEYEYSDIPKNPHSTTITTQVLRHTVDPTSQEYENVAIQQENVDNGAAVHFYDQSSAVRYITTSEGPQIQEDTGTSMDAIKPVIVSDDGTKSVIISTDEDGQIKYVPIEVAAQHNETKMAVQVSSGDNPQDVDTTSTTNNSVNDLMNQNYIPDKSTSSSSLISKVPFISEEKTTVEDTTQNNENSSEADNFTIQTVSLQEIVDSEQNTLPFTEQQSATVQANNEMQVEPDSDPSNAVQVSTSDISSVTQSVETGDTILDESSGVTVTYEEIETSHPSQSLQTSTVYVVTSSGILPITSKDA